MDENQPPSPPTQPEKEPPAPERKRRTSFNPIPDISPTPQPLIATSEELPPLPLLPRAASSESPANHRYSRFPGSWSPTPRRRSMPDRLQARRFAEDVPSPRSQSLCVPPPASPVSENSETAKRTRRGSKSKMLVPGVDPKKEDSTPWFG